MNARHSLRVNVRGRALLAVLVSLVVLAGFVLAAGRSTGPAAAPPPTSQPATGESAARPVPLAGIRLPDLDGTVVDLGSYLGKGPILLDFWATWCTPCLAALPELNQLHADLGPRGLQMLGINEDGQRNAAKVKPFVKAQRFDFPVLLDLDREAQDRLQVAVLPTTLLLDSKGNLLHTSFGYRPGEIDKLRQKIEPLLPDAKPK